MPHLFVSRTPDLASMLPAPSAHADITPETDTLSPHFEHRLEPCPRSDPEAESVRSQPSSHADQALLPHPPATPATAPARAPTQRLQRRRNQHYYANGLLYPVPAAAAAPAATTRPAPASPATAPLPLQSASANKRSKPYLTASGGTPSWRLSGTGAFTDARRQSWTGERRESRKLQKDHPARSARPSFTLEIPAEDDEDGNATPSGAAAATTARDGGGARGTVLGVRRRMEKLRGLYRRGEKEVMVPSNAR